jgi:hypothetical protein
MSEKQDMKPRQDLMAEVNDLSRQCSQLESYRRSLAEELHQVMQQRAQLKVLSGAGEATGSVLNLET